MKQDDLEFVAESIMLTIETEDLDGFKVMFEWGMEITDGDSAGFLEIVRRYLVDRGKAEAAVYLEEYVRELFK